MNTYIKKILGVTIGKTLDHRYNMFIFIYAKGETKLYVTNFHTFEAPLASYHIIRILLNNFGNILKQPLSFTCSYTTGLFLFSLILYSIVTLTAFLYY